MNLINIDKKKYLSYIVYRQMRKKVKRKEVFEIDDITLDLLNTLIFRQEELIKKILALHDITSRQLIYIIEKINDLINDSTIPEISVQKESILLLPTTREYFRRYLINEVQSKNIHLNRSNRKKVIILIVGCSPDIVSLNHLIEATITSKSTIMNDIRELREELELEYEIIIKYTRELGYYLSGKEEDIRNIIMKYIQDYLMQDNGIALLDQIAKELMISNIKNSSNQDKEKLIDKKINLYGNRSEEFFYTFFFLLPRLKRMDIYDFKVDLIVDKDLPEYKYIKYLAEKYNILESNIPYLYAFILSLTTGDIELETRDRDFILELVVKIYDQFEVYSGIYFTNKNAIIKRLYAHFRPAYYRMVFGFPVYNPLLNEVKKNYSEVFQLVNLVLRAIALDCDLNIREEEIGYITLYFASETYELNQYIRQKKNINALIICPNGVGTSLILQKELTELFPNFNFIVSSEKSLQKQTKEDIDIIFSTETLLTLLEVDIPFIVINPMMSEREKIRLVSRVYQQVAQLNLVNGDINDYLLIVKKHVTNEQFQQIEEELIKNHTNIHFEKGKEIMLSDIVSEDLVSLNIKASNWEEAIRKSTEVLVTEKKVTPNYIDAIIDSVNKNGPYIVITKHVALPHARPSEGAKELAISIATLEKPVEFGNKENDPVKYIFGLSALDNSTHLNAISELVTLLDNKEFFKVLDEAKSSKEIIEYIKNFKEEFE